MNPTPNLNRLFINQTGVTQRATFKTSEVKKNLIKKQNNIAQHQNFKKINW